MNDTLEARAMQNTGYQINMKKQTKRSVKNTSLKPNHFTWARPNAPVAISLRALFGLGLCLLLLSHSLMAQDTTEKKSKELQMSRLQYSVRSEAAEQFIAQMRSFADQNGGYMSSMKAGRLELRIPARLGRQKIETQIQSIPGTQIYRQERSSEDVAMQVADLQAQLKVAEKNLARLRELSKKAGLDDLLELEKALGRSLQKVESLKGQINYLKQSAKLYLVRLDINQIATTSSAKEVPIPWVRSLTLQNILRGSK